jgi:glycosyltransferase involved in cell wall biosynthesis
LHSSDIEKNAMPLENRDIIYIGSADWEAKTRTSTHHIAANLSKNNRVLYVDSIGQRAPQVSARDYSRIRSRITKFLKGPTVISDNLIHYSPLAIPFHKFAAARAFNRLFITQCLRAVSRKFGFKKPILIVFPPQMYFLPGKLGECVSAYYCIDEYSAFPGADRNSILAMEDALLRKTNLVFVSAEKLAARRKEVNPNVYYIPHGLDFDHFAETGGPDEPIFRLFLGIKRPIIGFFGSIAEWVNQELVVSAARSHPNWSFAFLGDIRVDVSKLRQEPNVYFSGYVDYKDLPGHAKSFDVNMIPFTEDEITKHVNPIKLREYLALGQPLVSTPMEEVEKFGDLVYMASGSQAFISAIEKALKEDAPQRRLARREAVRNDSWHSRAQLVCSHLKRYIKD